jgi:hypothetical protein
VTYYTRGQFINFCKEVFGPYRSVNGGANIEVVCPICKHLKKPRNYTKQKLAIQTDSHVVHCWVCGYKSKKPTHLLKKWKPGHLQKYLDKFMNAEDLASYYEYQNKTGEATPKVAQLPKDFTLLATADPTDPYIKAARNYLKGRGADSTATLWYWRLGVSKGDRKTFNRIIVPSFDQYGCLNFYSARAMTSGLENKYANPSTVLREDIIFNELNIDWTKELTLVEGAFDLMKSNENATAILSSDLPSHFLLFQKIVENKTPVVLALDPEAEKKSWAIAQRLSEFDVKVKILKLKPNQEDIGALTKSEFNDLLAHAKLFDVNYLLRTKIRQLV